jgi:hypothetical protein
MRVTAAIDDPQVQRRILRHLALWPSPYASLEVVRGALSKVQVSWRTSRMRTI